MAIHFRSIERRRTSRAVVCINVLAHGETADGEKFRFWTRTLSVSGHGGVLELESPLNEGQIFHLTNEYNLKKARARIVAVRRPKKGPISASFEFIEGGQCFWSMTFPASGAKPLRRFVARQLGAN